MYIKTAVTLHPKNIGHADLDLPNSTAINHATKADVNG